MSRIRTRIVLAAMLLVTLLSSISVPALADPGYRLSAADAGGDAARLAVTDSLGEDGARLAGIDSLGEASARRAEIDSLGESGELSRPLAQGGNHPAIHACKTSTPVFLSGTQVRLDLT